MPDSSAPVLEVADLGHSYGLQPCLDGVNLQVAPGEFLTILGASGCGKTTLLRAVAGLVLPQRGSITLGGRPVAKDGVERVPAERRGVGLVFQEYALFPHMTVEDNVAFGLNNGPNSAARTTQMLELVGLGDVAERRPAELSGGQQQRVALARALAPGPSLILLDEPFANLDAALRHGLRRELRSLLRKVDAAAVLVTHNREEALAIADRVAVFGVHPDRPNAGATVLRCGTPEEVYRDPRLAAVASLTGEASFVPSPDGGDEVLVLRPEDARFEAAEDGDCLISDLQFLGGRTSVTVQTPDGAVVIEIPAEEARRLRPDLRGRLHRLRPGSAVRR